MSPGVRKFALLVHVVVSVGTLGAISSFIALAIAGLMTTDPQLTGAAYVAMDIITRLVILPLLVGSLLGGALQSVGTPWGLLQHYWVVAKLGMTAAATAILFVHTQPIGALARAASAEPVTDLASYRGLDIQMLGASAAASLALLAMTILSVYKPRGLTTHGWRTHSRTQQKSAPSSVG
jgi:hypothetical protein